MYLIKFRTYKIALPPQTKPRRGGGLRHLPPSPFTGQFLRKADWIFPIPNPRSKGRKSTRSRIRSTGFKCHFAGEVYCTKGVEICILTKTGIALVFFLAGKMQRSEAMNYVYYST